MKCQHNKPVHITTKIMKGTIFRHLLLDNSDQRR